MGARRYTVLKILPLPDVKSDLCIVEIGSERGEGSTTFLADMAAKLGISFYTVDFDPVRAEEASKICKQFDNPEIAAFHMTGEDFLTNVFPTFGKKIFFLYLDNFDFIYDHIIGLCDKDISRYAELGAVLNNENSKDVHLRQTELALPFTYTGSFILCDDTFKRGHQWDGKCAYAVPFLLSKKWKIIDINEGINRHDDGFVLLQLIPV
jgi:hypothetical protein